MDEHMDRQAPHFGNVFCNPASAGKCMALLAWELHCKKANGTHCIHFASKHCTLTWGSLLLTQLYRFQTTTGLDMFAKADTPKREHKDVHDESLPRRCSLPMLKALCWCHSCSSHACMARGRQAPNRGSCLGRSLGGAAAETRVPPGLPRL